MLVRATLLLRNEKMLAARKRLGLTQGDLGALCGVSQSTIGFLERFNCSTAGLQRIAAEVAEILDLDLEDVMPASLVGKAVVASLTQIARVDSENLLAAHTRLSRRLTFDPAVGLEKEDLADKLEDVLHTLTYREREILKLRYGIGDGYTYTLKEVARIFQVSIERVRQVEIRAMRRLRRPFRKRIVAQCL